jgi:hypothetical protein
MVARQLKLREGLIEMGSCRMQTHSASDLTDGLSCRGGIDLA